jgi:hypothetical protein
MAIWLAGDCRQTVEVSYHATFVVALAMSSGSLLKIHQGIRQPLPFAS